ncbi:MAG: hypothetical protein QF578_14325 [Alphaproteobacteria bacterium]|jgi:hypothetical protein|nr:hypothetical protein [Alphaproteobacteria bacterium]MDP6565998.1 hypothetical protein [Alphaproteobacteria bacterium]MDP6815789.1 hypothetical protein [Alphaproteobacteria bacterium]
MLDRDDARRQILDQWQQSPERRRRAKPAASDMLMFYSRLQKDRPDLLNFDDHGDPWQQIHGWLAHHERGQG